MLDPNSLCAGVMTCMNVKFPSVQFPHPTLPGLPSVTLGFFCSMNAGIKYCLDFLPPNPGHLPKLPNIELFVKPFALNAKLPPMKLDLPGGSFRVGARIPDLDVKGPRFDISGMLKLVKLLILLPFMVIKLVIESIINLSLKIPDAPTIKGLAFKVGLDLGIPRPTLDLYVPCLVKGAAKALSVMG